MTKDDKKRNKLLSQIPKDKLMNTLPDTGEPFKDHCNEYDWKEMSPPSEPDEPEDLLEYGLEEKLAPLDDVILVDDLMDDVVERTAIPNLLDGEEPSYSGVILFGPPGTGKTVLLRAICEVYKRSGAFAKEVSVASVNSRYVSELAKNLEAEIQMAIQEAKKRGKPSFIYFDEASILTQKAEEGASSVSKHYQEALDVLKKYVGNHREFVLGVSTNLLSHSFDEALVRDGRLTPFFIGYPEEEQRGEMWRYFADKYDLMDLTSEQSVELARITPSEQGAFIEEFCRNYRRTRRRALLKEKGYATLVAALKEGVRVTEEEVMSSVSYPSLMDDVCKALEEKGKRNGDRQNGDGVAGFKLR